MGDREGIVRNAVPEDLRQGFGFKSAHVLDAESAFENLSTNGSGFVERPELRPTTRFEARGARLGHEVFDLAYRRR